MEPGASHPGRRSPEAHTTQFHDWEESSFGKPHHSLPLGSKEKEVAEEPVPFRHICMMAHRCVMFARRHYSLYNAATIPYQPHPK